MDAAGARDRLRDILHRRAVMRGEFVLSSGMRSEYYLDARVVTLSAEAASLVGAVFLDVLHEVDAVAGLAVGADPIVSSIATMAGLTGRDINGLIVRKEPKQHGVGGRIIGPWRKGLRVAIVDDTFTTGASALTAARVIEDAGGTVTGVNALIDREEGAREAIEEAGYSFAAIFLAHELL